MATLKIEERAWSDPRLKKLQSALKISRVEAIGILATLWHDSQELLLSEVTGLEIHQFLGFKKDKSLRIIQALLDANYIFEKNLSQEMHRPRQSCEGFFEKIFCIKGTEKRVARIDFLKQISRSANEKRWSKYRESKLKNMLSTEQQPIQNGIPILKVETELHGNPIDSKIERYRDSEIERYEIERVINNNNISENFSGNKTINRHDGLTTSAGFSADTKFSSFSAQDLSNTEPQEDKPIGGQKISSDENLGVFNYNQVDDENLTSNQADINKPQGSTPIGKIEKIKQLRNEIETKQQESKTTNKTRKIINANTSTNRDTQEKTNNVIAFYFDVLKTKRQFTPPVVSKKEAGILKNLLSSMGYEKLTKCLDAFVSMENRWFETMGWNLKTFNENLNAIQRFIETGKDVSYQQSNFDRVKEANKKVLEEIWAEREQLNGDHSNAGF